MSDTLPRRAGKEELAATQSLFFDAVVGAGEGEELPQASEEATVAVRRFPEHGHIRPKNFWTLKVGFVEKQEKLFEPFAGHAVRDKLKVLLVDQLSLEDVTPEEIGDDMELFGEGLGLDSLDAVEIVVMLQRNFGMEVKDMEKSREVFKTIGTLADYVYEKTEA